MKLKSGKAGIAAVCGAIFILVAACTTNPFTGEEEVSKTRKGAMIGGAGGAVIGVISGSTQTALNGYRLVGDIRGGCARADILSSNAGAVRCEAMLRFQGDSNVSET